MLTTFWSKYDRVMLKYRGERFVTTWTESVNYVLAAIPFAVTKHEF